MSVTPVFDSTDPRLRDYVSLKDVSLRRTLEAESGLYIAESAAVIRRAIASGHDLRSLLMAESWISRSSDLIEAADLAGAPVYVAPRDVLESVAGYRVHRGALAAVHRPVLPSIADVIDGSTRVVVLADIVDHTNVGAIFRSVAGLGADAVLVSPQCADPLYRRSVRVSMGAVLQVPWTRFDSWPGVLGTLRERGFLIAAMALDSQSVDLVDLGKFSTEAPSRVALVLGAEGDGLSPEVIAGADVALRIPMAGAVDSLNVAAAAAVAMWELRAHA